MQSWYRVLHPASLAEYHTCGVWVESVPVQRICSKCTSMLSGPDDIWLFRDILRTFWSATTALLPIFGRIQCMTYQIPLVTVHVWIVIMKRGCARPTQDMVVGQDGLSGALAVSHVVGE